MNLVFNVGEQIAELEMLSKESVLPGVAELMGAKFWQLLIEEDAKNLLRHYMRKRSKRAQHGAVNRLFTEAVVRLLMEVGYDADDAGKSILRIYRDPTNFYLEDNEQGGLTVLHKKDLPIGLNGAVLDPPAPFKRKSLEHYIDDFIDEVYYEIHLEIDDFVHGFSRRGDIWTCKSHDNHLLFDYCCNSASVEAAVRASGGNFADFIAYMTS